jgi:hypothetical protein
MDRPWLRELRGDRTFRELAGEENGTGYLSLLEAGKRTPVVTNIPKLAALYGIDPLVMAERFMQEAT